jgi:hypothetical protein
MFPRVKALSPSASPVTWFSCHPATFHTQSEINALIEQIGELDGEMKVCMEHTGRYYEPEYITLVSIGPQPTDATTLIPFLKEMEENLSFRYKKVVADAGYKSEENYHYLEGNGQLPFIKTTNYEISKTRKYKADIGRAQNMEYREEEDEYLCKNGKRLTVSGLRKQKSRSGYERETTVYSCGECSGCPYKKECIKGNNSKKPLEERNKSM